MRVIMILQRVSVGF